MSNQRSSSDPLLQRRKRFWYSSPHAIDLRSTGTVSDDGNGGRDKTL